MLQLTGRSLNVISLAGLAFAVGMVIYWTWSNVLSIVQQYAIMRRQGVETQLDQFIAKRLRRENAKPAG